MREHKCYIKEGANKTIQSLTERQLEGICYNGNKNKCFLCKTDEHFWNYYFNIF